MPDSPLVDGPKRSYKSTIILAHGAGAPMDSDFMNSIATGLANKKHRVIRFEFPYMQQQRKTGKKRPPNGMNVLLESFRDIIDKYQGEHLFIGGKSMGGRVASMIADQVTVSGTVCLGYPFHAPGKPEKPRIEHLEKMKTPTLILQGERDPFGKPDEINSYKLSKKIIVRYLTDGDHSFKPRMSSGTSHEENLSDCVEQASAFVMKLTG